LGWDKARTIEAGVRSTYQEALQTKVFV
jgi:hypothetical protein